MGISAVSVSQDCQVLVAGAGECTREMVKRLRKSGIDGVLVVGAPAAHAEFDQRSDRWLVRTAEGRAVSTRILIAGRPPSRARLDEAFLGLAAYGLPNFFCLTAKKQAGYIAGCLDLMARDAATRIEVRAAVQRAWLRRDHRSRARALRAARPEHFDLTAARDRRPAEEYRGPALLASAADQIPVTVSLAGHREPIDGRYHWYGRVAANDAVIALRRPGNALVTLTLPDGQPTPAKLAEVDPWGNVRVTGVGVPPYRVEPLEEIDAER